MISKKNKISSGNFEHTKAPKAVKRTRTHPNNDKVGKAIKKNKKDEFRAVEIKKQKTKTYDGKKLDDGEGGKAKDVSTISAKTSSRALKRRRSEDRTGKCDTSKRQKVACENPTECRTSRLTVKNVRKGTNQSKKKKENAATKKKSISSSSSAYLHVHSVQPPAVVSFAQNENQGNSQSVFKKASEESFGWSHTSNISKESINSNKYQSINSNIGLSSLTLDASEPTHSNTVSPLELPIIKQVYESSWTDEEYLAGCEGIGVTTARNIISLLKSNNTIPFIARYRSHLTGNLNPDRLRKIKATCDYIDLVHKKAEQLANIASSQKALDEELRLRIREARTVEELELIGASFKKNISRSLAEQAKELGLEVPARLVLEGQGCLIPESFVKPGVRGLKDKKTVMRGIQHIIADIISKDTQVHILLEKIKTSKEIKLQSQFRKEAESGESSDKSKYKLYANFTQSMASIKPHQIMAINRGESEKELSVKISIPDDLWTPLRNYCFKKWMTTGNQYPLRLNLFNDSVEDAIKRLIAPLVVRRVRAKLNEEAEDEAVQVFVSNLRDLLLTPPCRGKVVMAIDPGFGQGCKVAVVSPIGSHLELTKFFLSQKHLAKEKLVQVALKHKCETIVLGNGTACRETEALLTDLIQNDAFQPLNVSYTIISEQGVSIYSCSTAAMEEFPNLHPTFVGAISLARRFQDPLSELVKIEPKHLGVGMYQHDVKEKKLMSALDEVVSECVSFVGVDINSASLHLLKRVAGLSQSKAEGIIKHRSKNCPFQCRDDLMKVKGISVKTFQQCAGFIRILPATAQCRGFGCCKNEFNPLDETCIHPESYDLVHQLIRVFSVDLKLLGSQMFIETLEKRNAHGMVNTLAKKFGVAVEMMTFLIDALTKPKNVDLRSLNSGPIYRRGFRQIENIKNGDRLLGVVRNLVPFGAFVDIGIGHNGLIHNSKMGGQNLHLLSNVDVQVEHVDLEKGRIQLKLISVVH